MRKFRTITLALLILVLCVPLVGASAWVTNAVSDRLSHGATVRFSATVDSVDTLTGNYFSFAKYDADSFVTYPVAYGRILASTSGKPRINAILHGSYDNSNWFVVDTVGAVTDSLETYGIGTVDLNNKKCPFYRMVYYGTAGNRSDTTVRLVFYLYRQDVQ